MTLIVVGLTLGIACSLGYIGYFAFGSGSKSMILYNLPNEDAWCTTAKVLYIITVMGSFPIVAHPIFHLLENSNFYKYGTCTREEDTDDLESNSL
jgi:amino acid permease